MNAIAYRKFGNIDVLQTVEETKPSIQTNQVLVKVKAVSTCYTLQSIRENMDLLLSAIHKGLQIEVNKVFHFDQIKEAHQYAEQGGYIGKVAVGLN
jgi:NADPH:quinone reductase-like Zn-dependent oxidoreductase